MSTLGSIPWSSYEKLVGNQVDYVDGDNDKRRGRLCGFKIKYGTTQFAVIKRKSDFWGRTKVDHVPPSAIFRENFQRLGIAIEKEKVKSNPVSHSFPRVSLEDSAYIFRYGESEYQKIDSYNGFKIGDQVVWKTASADPTKPLIGTIQMIGNSVHSRSYFAAVVSFDEPTKHLPRYVSLGEGKLHRNIVGLDDLQELGKYTTFWTPHNPNKNLDQNRNENISTTPKLYSVQQEQKSFPTTSHNVPDEPLIKLSDDKHPLPQLYHKVELQPQIHLPSSSKTEILQPENKPKANIPAPLVSIESKFNLEGFLRTVQNSKSVLGFQGHNSSCHLDSSLFALFAFSQALQKYILKNEAKPIKNVKIIVQEWKANYFVGEETLGKLRQDFVKEFGPSFQSSYKDAEETMLALFTLLQIPPLFHYYDGDGDHIHQIVMPMSWDPSQRKEFLTLQTLLPDSFTACEVSLKEIPKNCFIIKLPVSEGVLVAAKQGVVPNLTLDLSPILKSKEKSENNLLLSAVILLRGSHFVTVVRISPDKESDWIFMDSRPTTSKPEVKLLKGVSSAINMAESGIIYGLVRDYQLPNGFMLFRDAYIAIYTPADQFMF